MVAKRLLDVDSSRKFRALIDQLVAFVQIAGAKRPRSPAQQMPLVRAGQVGRLIGALGAADAEERVRLTVDLGQPRGPDREERRHEAPTAAHA